MGRMSDFEGDSVTCDSRKCDTHVRVPDGQIASGWFLGMLDSATAQGDRYDACSPSCALDVNIRLHDDQAADTTMTWWRSNGKTHQTIVRGGSR